MGNAVGRGAAACAADAETYCLWTVRVGLVGTAGFDSCVGCGAGGVGVASASASGGIDGIGREGGGGLRGGNPSSLRVMGGCLVSAGRTGGEEGMGCGSIECA